MGQARRGRVRRGDKALPRVRSPPISASAITGQMIHFNLAISPEGEGKLVARRRDWLRNAPRSELGALSRTGRVQPHFCAEVSPEPGLPTTAVPPLAFQIPFFSDSHRSILPLPLKTRHKNHRYSPKPTPIYSFSSVLSTQISTNSSSYPRKLPGSSQIPHLLQPWLFAALKWSLLPWNVTD